MAGVVAAASVALLAAGCTSGAGGGPSTTQGSGVVASSEPTTSGSMQPLVFGGACPTTANDPAIVKLRANPPQVAVPAHFAAVAVVRCVAEYRTVPGDGEWEFSDAQRADSGLAAFLAALRLPSVTPSPGEAFACPAEVPMSLALVDAHGAIVNPSLPHNACGSLTQVTSAISALPWKTVTEQRISQIQTQSGLDSGCEPQYKDVFELPVPKDALPWSKVRRPGNPEPNEVCVYALSRTSGSTLTVGTFAKAVRLTAAQQDAVVKALDLTGDAPAPKCTRTASRMVVMAGPGADGIIVELDGCQRLMWPNGFVAAAPGALLQALRSLH
jgi:hypothetical protein